MEKGLTTLRNHVLNVRKNRDGPFYRIFWGEIG
ncbi:hypothetical protein GGP88_003017 [Salinibacter ruber]|nr:hypothetical protein [Salinibacter ruber]